MLSEREVSASIGGTAYSSSGDKIGTVEHYFVDDRTGAPTWVAVSTGLFGTRHSIVPATEATFADGSLRLPVTVDSVKSAPHLTGDHLSPDEEGQLRRHYGMESATTTAAGWTPTDEGLRPPGAAGGDESAGPATTDASTAAAPLPPPPPSYGVPAEERETTATGTTQVIGASDTDGAMVRSEEQLRVGTERAAATRMRVVKYVVTEEVQITVPIRREEIRVEEVPVDAADDAGESLVPDDADNAGRAAEERATGGLPDEIILHTERPVVSVEVVPRERVRLRTEVVEGQETVTGQVQREQIVVDETPSSGPISPR